MKQHFVSDRNFQIIYILNTIYVCTSYTYCRYKGINLKLKKKTCLNPKHHRTVLYYLFLRVNQVQIKCQIYFAVKIWYMWLSIEKFLKPMSSCQICICIIVNYYKVLDHFTAECQPINCFWQIKTSICNTFISVRILIVCIKWNAPESLSP